MNRVTIVVSSSDDTTSSYLGNQILGWLRAGGFQVGITDQKNVGVAKPAKMVSDSIVHVEVMAAPKLTVTLAPEKKAMTKEEFIAELKNNPDLLNALQSVVKPVDPGTGGTQVVEPAPVTKAE